MSGSSRGFGAVLRNRPFLFLWMAQAISQVAQNGANLVQIVLIETLTHSSGQIALMVLAFSLPAALLSLIAGVVVDRVSNRLILIASNVLRALFTLGYLAAYHWLFDWSALLVIYLLTFVNSAVGQFFAPAEAATIPALVNRQGLLSANALFNLTMTIAQVIGLVLLFPLIVKFGNTIAPHFGIDIAFVLIVVMYLLATLLVLALPPDHHRFHPNQTTSLAQTLRDIRDGWSFVHATPAIYMPILHLTTVAMLVMVLVTIGPGFASRVLALSPEDAIYIFGPAGIGMLISTVGIGRFGHRFLRDQLSTIGELAISVVLASLAAVGWASSAPDMAAFNLTFTPIVMLLAFLLGISLALIAVPAQTSLQERSPVELRGRVFALLYTLTSLVVIVPLLFIGALADRIGIPVVSLLIALLTLVVALYSLTRTRRLADFVVSDLSEP